MRRHSWWFVGLLVAVLLLGSVPAASANGAWWNTNWGFRRKLTFDNLQVDENLTDFPVLVCLDTTNIDYNQTQDNGGDIRFVDLDGTVLKHEIEKWDETGTSYVWVKVPQIDASPATDHMWMYYGNPLAPDGQDPTQVWTNGFAAVWHLSETTGGTGAIKDSTANNNDGTDYHTPTLGATGQIDGAVDLNGTDEWIFVDDDNSLDITEGTLEAWVNPDVQGGGNGWDRLVGKELNNLTDAYVLLISNDDGDADLWSCDAGAGRDRIRGVTTVQKDVWTYVVGTRNATANTSSIYLNGGLDVSAADNNNFCQTYHPVRIGASNVDFLDGTVDEVRISSVPRSAEWIEAQYKSMTCGLIKFGAQETPPPAVPVGGYIVPVSRLELLAPWMGLVALAALAAFTVGLVRRRRA
jgi:hypothetical protein